MPLGNNQTAYLSQAPLDKQILQYSAAVNAFVPQYGTSNAINLAAATAAQTISLNQSGFTFFLPQCTTATTVTMPAATAGFKCEVILANVVDGSHTVTFAFPATTLIGVQTGVAAGLVPVTGGTHASPVTNLILGSTAANSKISDGFRCWSDGTLWYYNAWSSGTAAGWTTS